MRAVKVAFSLDLPSRRKNEPGILPAAYMRSSRSTVRGKKSAPSRADLDAVAVTSTTVSPRRTVTAPSAWPANLPVSMIRVLSVPATGPDTVMASATMAPFRAGRRRARLDRSEVWRQFPVERVGHGRGSGPHHWQLTHL